jgi:hypothetical protein
MGRFFAQKHTEELLNRLERSLDTSLHPVPPDPVFTSTLRYRLVNSPSVVLENASSSIGLLVVAAGLFLGILLVWVLRRLH